MIFLDKKKLDRIISELDSGKTIGSIARNHDLTTRHVSKIRFEVDMHRAKKQEPTNEIYKPEDLDGEELKIYLGLSE